MKISRLPKPKKCPATHKTMFNKQHQAQRAMMRVISHDPHADMFDLHTYQCESCGHWHFGHQKWFKTEIEVTDAVSIKVA